MAGVRITYWREIPVLVTAHDGTGASTVPLSARFQELVDGVAMQEGLHDADAYLEAWRVGPEEDRPGPAARAAAAVAAELEARFGEIRLQCLRPPGPDAR